VIFDCFAFFCMPSYTTLYGATPAFTYEMADLEEMID
jgi:hypothetical protein